MKAVRFFMPIKSSTFAAHIAKVKPCGHTITGMCLQLWYNKPKSSVKTIKAIIFGVVAYIGMTIVGSIVAIVILWLTED